jgi:hypothetical protein
MQKIKLLTTTSKQVAKETATTTLVDWDEKPKPEMVKLLFSIFDIYLNELPQLTRDEVFSMAELRHY